MTNTKSSLSDAKVLKDSENYPWMFSILVDRYQKAFLRKGMHILRSRDLAEDAVQETFIKIYKYAHKFSERRGNASFRPWAYKILVNICYSLAAKNATNMERVKVLDFADLDTAGGISETNSREQASLVSSILSRLPARLSRLLKLSFFEQKSYEEIAIAEDISLSAARSGLYRAKKQFKNIALEIL